jgi:hypothetical protein
MWLFGVEEEMVAIFCGLSRNISMYQRTAGRGDASETSPGFSRPKSRFARTAAKICFCSLFAGLLTVVSCIALLGPPRTSEFWKTAAFLATASLWLFGICFGVVAIKETKQHGSKGLFWCSLIGVMINLMLFGAISYLLVYRHQSSVQNAKAAALEQRYDNEARQFSNAYNTASAALTNPPVLSMALVREKADLEARKQSVLACIAASQELIAFGESAPARLEKELSRANLSPDVRKEYLQHFIRSTELDKPETLKIKKAVVLFGQAVLNYLNLLEQNWGKWTYDPKTETVRSTNGQFMDNLTRDWEKITEVKSEIKQLRKQLKEEQGEQ